MGPEGPDLSRGRRARPAPRTNVALPPRGGAAALRPTGPARSTPEQRPNRCRPRTTAAVRLPRQQHRARVKEDLPPPATARGKPGGTRRRRQGIEAKEGAGVGQAEAPRSPRSGGQRGGEGEGRKGVEGTAAEVAPGGGGLGGRRNPRWSRELSPRLESTLFVYIRSRSHISN